MNRTTVLFMLVSYPESPYQHQKQKLREAFSVNRINDDVVEIIEWGSIDLMEFNAGKPQLACLLATIAISVAQQSPLEQQNPKEPIAIVKYDNEGVNADGSYQWSLETANGITAQEEGHLKKSDAGEDVEEVSGSFQYTANDGTPIKLTYTANENGFQPQGEHLPTPPAIPPAIQRALEWITAHAPPADQKEAPARK